MSLDASHGAATATEHAAHAAPAAGDGGNEAVTKAIRAHHAGLADQLAQLTAAVLTAARLGDCDAARARLHDWYRSELLPHIVAEEKALYTRGADLETTRLLVAGMLDEHRALVSLVAELALARDAFDVAITAASSHTLFRAHLDKENEQLLPALDAAGLELAPILDGMHEILGQAQPAHEHADSCGHDHGTQPTSAVAVQIGAAPAQFPPPPPAPEPIEPGDLDVRTLPHGQRHDIIFSRLDALERGDALVIVNDHDPKPLRYQTSALWPGKYEWSYAIAGPQVWRVAITRVS